MGFLSNLFGLGRRREPQPSMRVRAEIDESDYTLVPFDGDAGETGNGFVVQRDDGQRLAWDNLPRGDGLESLPVAGTSHRRDTLQDDAFRPGQALRLAPEPENQHDRNAVGIWDAAAEKQVGYVPGEHSARIAKKLAAGKIAGCISMWETRADGRRVGLRILLIGPNARLRVIAE